jgi:hypothetical protein
MTNDGDITQRVIVKKIIAEDPKKFEVVHIMSNGGDPTQWVTVNSDMGTRVGGEYETTTQSSQDIDAFTEHSKPRAMRKSWDTEPPPADIDASDKSWDTGQPPADIDAAQDAGTNTYTHSVSQAFQEDDEDWEEDIERSEQLFGYDPDRDVDVWAEYQAAMEDPMFAY